MVPNLNFEYTSQWPYSIEAFYFLSPITHTQLLKCERVWMVFDSNWISKCKQHQWKMFKWITLIFSLLFVLSSVKRVKTILLFLTHCYLQLIACSLVENVNIDSDDGEKLSLNWTQSEVVVCSLSLAVNGDMWIVCVYVCVNHCVRRIEIAYLSWIVYKLFIFSLSVPLFR